MAPGAWAAALLAAGCRAAASEFIADLHKAQARHERAEQVEYFSRALRAWQPADGRPLLAECRYGRGRALYELGRSTEARTDLAEALAIDPNNDQAAFLLGQALTKLGRTREAVAQLAAYAAARPQDEAGWLALGRAQLRAGRPADAAASFGRAQAAAPADGTPAIGLAETLAARGRCAEALATLQRVQPRADARAAGLWSARARCQAALGGRAQALESYGRALPLYEERLFALRRSDDAQPVEVADYQEEAARAYFDRGRLRAELGRTDAAADHARACELGLAQACTQAPAIDARAASPRKRRTKVRSDAGDRIYAN